MAGRVGSRKCNDGLLVLGSMPELQSGFSMRLLQLDCSGSRRSVLGVALKGAVCPVHLQKGARASKRRSTSARESRLGQDSEADEPR